MKKILVFFLALMHYITIYAEQVDPPQLVAAENFLSIPIQDEVAWSTLEVPMNWNDSSTTRIKLAVAVIKSKNKGGTKEGVVFIQGGPGGGAVASLVAWLNHPLRAEKDIVLVDLRGTGFSEPSLCPDLGQSFMRILAENYSAEEEIKERVKAASKCREKLENDHIDFSAFNSQNIAFDLHALKEQLGYEKWSVYGVSYGTRVAYEYATYFEEDIDKLILDSPIPLDRAYLDHNTSNFMSALNKVFVKCKNDKKCVQEYGDIEEAFYASMKDLSENPIEVEVPTSIHPSGKFVLNAHDFAIALQQGLYDKNLTKVLPLMIKEFENRNKDMIAALVSALGMRLSLDYGTYYSMICNDEYTSNAISSYNDDASASEGILKKGLPFYKGDYFICNDWLGTYSYTERDSLVNQFKNWNQPTLIFSGEFDPITPPQNGEALNKIIKGSNYLYFPEAGHAPAFSDEGRKVVAKFINENEIAKVPVSKYNFVTDIAYNKGVFRFSNSLLSRNYIVIAALALILLFFIGTFIYVLWQMKTKWKIFSKERKIVSILSVASSLLGTTYIISILYGMLQTVNYNFYILVFGLPNKYFLSLLLPWGILILSVLIIYFMLAYKMEQRKMIAWGLVPSISLIAFVLYFGLFHI